MLPFLKWAGGKRWLAQYYDELNIGAGRYFEPFFGGGAFFFRFLPEKAVISDANSELIITYLAIQRNYKEVENYLFFHKENHSKEYYYYMRGLKVNGIYQRAARFIYLNKTCWNGLYRVNKDGQFNVPIGTKNKIIESRGELKCFNMALKTVEVLCSDFESVIDKSRGGDFLFIDPPYTVKHNENGFVKYNEKIFSWEDQVRLSLSLKRASERGAKFLMTNANHQSIKDLYQWVECFEVKSRSSIISGDSSKRGRFEELIIRRA